MACAIQLDFFVFASEIEKLMKSNRVKDGVIVCEIGIRVRDVVFLCDKRIETIIFSLLIIFRNILRVCG